MLQNMETSLEAAISSPWLTFGLLFIVLSFMIAVSCWTIYMKDTSPLMAAPAPPERRRSGIPATAPAGIAVRAPPTRRQPQPQPQPATLPPKATKSPDVVCRQPTAPQLPDAGMPDLRPSMFQVRPSTAMWQGGPEVTQYRVWADPNRPKTEERVTPESRSSHSSHDEETETMVTFLKPRPFESTGHVPEKPEITGWLDQGGDSGRSTIVLWARSEPGEDLEEGVDA